MAELKMMAVPTIDSGGGVVRKTMNSKMTAKTT